jgi:predicted Fe-Mo cluster-binding NifX family protein
MEKKMRVCIVCHEGVVSQHMGQSEQVSLYEVYGDAYEMIETISVIGHEHEGIPRVVCSLDPDVLICGKMGTKAYDKFTAKGISMFMGAEGSVDDVMNLYVKGLLKAETSLCTSHVHNHGCNHH